jgi:nucleotide-binding universal stress UspA family protein
MKILVATDGSKNALRAVKFAIALVKDSSLKTNSITVISVHDDAGLRHAKSFVGSDAITDYLRELSDKSEIEIRVHEIIRGKAAAHKREVELRRLLQPALNTDTRGD